VGGDLYDFYIRDEKLFFCIGDVSGKGAPAAMVMSVIHSLFRAFSAHENNPAHIMQSVNEVSCEGNDACIFVTFFIGVLDLPTGRLRYCDAGHDAPIILKDGKLSNVDALPHIPVGLFDDVKYGVQETQLEPDSTLFLYTDGLTEAKDIKHKLYGLERIQKTLAANSQLQPQQLLEAVTASVHAFVGEAQQSDDLTMLAIHYHRPEETIVLQETQLLTNDVKQVPQLNQFIQSVSGKLNLDRSLTSQLMLAVEEAVVNVMSYAYPLGTKGDIAVEARATDQWLKFIITDEGKAFDPTQNTKADTTLNAEDRPIGGLGILLVQQLMDTINYERIDGKNVLTLKKIIQTGDNK
jgi:sigma-B regulation protein RsbU (phosphoserine phosphatase)